MKKKTVVVVLLVVMMLALNTMPVFAAEDRAVVAEPPISARAVVEDAGKVIEVDLQYSDKELAMLEMGYPVEKVVYQSKDEKSGDVFTYTATTQTPPSKGILTGYMTTRLYLNGSPYAEYTVTCNFSDVTRKFSGAVSNYAWTPANRYLSLYSLMAWKADDMNIVQKTYYTYYGTLRGITYYWNINKTTKRPATTGSIKEYGAL